MTNAWARVVCVFNYHTRYISNQSNGIRIVPLLSFPVKYEIKAFILRPLSGSPKLGMIENEVMTVDWKESLLNCRSSERSLCPFADHNDLAKQMFH